MTPARTDQRIPTASGLWDRWLVAVLVVVLAYSALLVVRGSVADEVFSRLGFGMAGTGIDSTAGRRHVLLVYGVLGATMIGWAVLLLAVVTGPLRRREPWAWLAVTGSVGCWFALDSGLSLALGSPAHAAFNVVFLVAVAPPLIGLARPRSRDQA